MLLALYALQAQELRPLLPIRTGVVATDLWTPALDAVATLKRWRQVAAIHYAQLGQLGERILLSVRLRDWVRIDDPGAAAAWARYWRQDVQNYALTFVIVQWPAAARASHESGAGR
jgi:hypothetical protein